MPSTDADFEERGTPRIVGRTDHLCHVIHSHVRHPGQQFAGFFDAYTTALHNAFVDFIVDTPELIQILNETFDDAVDEYHR